MNIKTIIISCLIFSVGKCLAQTTVYIAPNGKTLSEQAYRNAKTSSLANARKNYGADYQLLEKLELTSKSTDSIKYSFRWEFMNEAMIAEKKATDKLIGTVLSIKDLNFLDSTSQTKIDDGKPTFLNFWFTSCIPCIEELPALNELKKRYSDKMNFVSITFDDRKRVELFLKARRFDFHHIVDEKKLTDSLGITGYPKSFLLDKNQRIQVIQGALPATADQSAYQLQLSQIAGKINKLL